MWRRLRNPRKGLSTEHVAWAYRLFLDREPESAARTAEKAATWSTTRQLRVDFMTSAEFGRQNPDLALVNEPNVVIKEIAPGLRLFIDLADQVVGMGILRGTYERDELETARRWVRAGDTVLDIGANVGLFTVHLADRVGPTGRVYAFEPAPALADLLARSVEENRFGERVELIRAAVADREGTAQLFSGHDPLNRSGSYLLRDGPPAEVPGEVRDVPLVRLDDLDLRRPVSFLKIDIEGAEPLALRGAERLLRTDRPTILAEVNPPQLARAGGSDAASFLQEMADRGYLCRALDGTPLQGDRLDHRLRSVVFEPTTDG